MPKLTFRLPSGEDTVLDGDPALSVMQNATGAGIEGIVAECGGSLACATCHVYVEGGPVDLLPEISEDEDAMLDCTAAPREATSRLSCQLPVSDELDGLVLRVAPEQY